MEEKTLSTDTNREEEVTVSLLADKLHVLCIYDDTVADLQRKLQHLKPTLPGTCYQIVKDAVVLRGDNNILSHGKVFTAVVQDEVDLVCVDRHPRELRLGDELEVLTGGEIIVGNKECLESGDRGRVSKDIYIGKDGIARCDITWYRTGQTSTFEKDEWTKKLRHTANVFPNVPGLGDEVEALPGETYSEAHHNYYAPGDRGRVSGESYVDPKDGIERFNVTWGSTGLTSSVKIEEWLKRFRFSAVGIRVPNCGDEMEVLPGVTFQSDGMEYYGPGDLGRVSKDSSACPSNNFEVTWYRTRKVSTMQNALWLQSFRPTGSHVVVPRLGDEVTALPGISLTVSGMKYYKEGDAGRVCKDTYVSEEDHIKRFEVTWYRTGLTSTMVENKWMDNFRWLRAGLIKVPCLGDEVQTFPGIFFSLNDLEYYGPHDQGRVSGDRYIDESDGIERFFVTWYRTGRTSTMKVEQWARNFFPIGTPVQLPRVGDEVEALPGISLIINGLEYYVSGDRGRMCRNVYVDAKDDEEKFEIAWYRSGLISTMKKKAWLKNFRFTKCGIEEPRFGDEMEVLPCAKLAVEGREYYVPGDRGRVSKDSCITPSDGIRRFEVTWYRSKLTSTMKTDMWLRNFRPIGTCVPLPILGDEVEALANISLSIDGKEYYSAGDRGRVSRDVEVTKEDGIERFEVTWFRTGETSTMMKSKWMHNFRFIVHTIKLPQLGDELETLPCAQLVANGKEYYIPGDRGRVSKETYITEADGIERFEVAWYRTGLTSTMKKDQWLRHFRFIESGIKVPTFGDEVEVLPGISLTVEGKEYYTPGDKGRVSKNTYLDSKDGVERLEITWYRTGLTSTMRKDRWLNNFRPIVTCPRFIECGKTPRCNDEVQALPGIGLTVNGVEYYQECDKGRVVKDTYVDLTDNIERFEITWYRTGRRSTMKTQCWPRNFALTIFDSELLDDETCHWNEIRDLSLAILPEKTFLPTKLRSLTFADNFNRCLHAVNLPRSLRMLAFGTHFNQNMENVLLPSSLQSLTFGEDFNQPLRKLHLPSGLQTLTFGNDFNQSLSEVSLPIGLQTLTFGTTFNQAMHTVRLPSGLRNLRLGANFEQSLEKLSLPSGLQSLTLGANYSMSLDKVALPCGCEIKREP